jgi:pyruvate ferredoxin oxidoreductase alpha subunit
MSDKNNKQILEGSYAIALTIKNIHPAVISAYPITPQTHIVEDLAKFKADGEADYEYVRAESEFAAASIIAGASAAGARVYSATSSQGLLLMAEVVYNIAGMRLPIVMTCANRAVSAPINIWNDQQDVMAVRDAGWIMLFAEDHQEAVNQHIMAYKIAEKLLLPVMVNVDGFVLTHTYEPVTIPTEKEIKKYLPDYKPEKGHYLDPANPITMGALVTPAHYMEIREDLHNDLMVSLKTINEEYKKFKKIFNPKFKIENLKFKILDNGLLEYYGPKNPNIILVAMGSVIGTIKEVADEVKNIGVLKVKTYRPFPGEEIVKILKKTKYIAVIDKSISLGQIGPLASDIKSAAQGKISAKIQSFIVGLGGRDVTRKMIRKIIGEVKKNGDGIKFMGK